MPPKAVNRNVYEMTDEERKIFGIEKIAGKFNRGSKRISEGYIYPGDIRRRPIKKIYRS